MSDNVPAGPGRIVDDYSDVWDEFQKLSTACHEAGPLDTKTRRLVKLALSIGAGLEGATHSAVRHAVADGISAKEMEHVAVLAITTLGLPAATRGLSWIRDPITSNGDPGEEAT